MYSRIMVRVTYPVEDITYRGLENLRARFADEFVST